MKMEGVSVRKESGGDVGRHRLSGHSEDGRRAAEIFRRGGAAATGRGTRRGHRRQVERDGEPRGLRRPFP